MSILLPYQFDLESRPYQTKILSDSRKNKVLAIHRRAGKTSLAINKLIHEAFLPQNAGKVFYYVCPTQRQAKEIVWKAPDMLIRYLPPEIVEKKNEVELTIYLTNGSQIYVKGADDPDALRGTNPYGLILDEYAQMKPEVYDEVFRPVLAANGGWVWFMGTPKGKNDFYKKLRYAQDHPETWDTIILQATESNIIPREALEQARIEMPEQMFLQEFECEFLEGNGTVFRRVLENVKNKFQEPERGRQYKMGLDLAKTVDFTVMTVVDRHTHEVVCIDRFNQIDYNLQKSRIEALARRYNNCPITIDESSIGSPIGEDLRRVGLQVDGFKFTNESKKNLIESLSLLIEQNLISYPNHAELLQELQDYTYTIQPSGKFIYNAPEGSHDDLVISLALAFWRIGDKISLGNLPTKSYGFDFNMRQSGYSKPIFK